MRTGATVVGSYETVRVLAAAGVPEKQLLAVSGSERIELDETTSVRVLPGLHACAWSDRAVPEVDEYCLGDLGVPWHERTRRLTEGFWPALQTLGDDVRTHLEDTVQGDRGDGGVLTYVIETSGGPCCSRTPSAAGARCWAANVPTSPSSPRPGAATSTVSQSKAPPPDSSPNKLAGCTPAE